MVKTIALSDEVYARLEALAIPFEDREPEDVIRKLLDSRLTTNVNISDNIKETLKLKISRAPRERGAVIELNGERISATTVPDLCTKIMDFIYSNGLWEQFVSLAPYMTSAKRYLYSKSPKHPQGNDFFVPIKNRNIYMEAHKNYETTLKQLNRLLTQLGVTFKYLQ